MIGNMRGRVNRRVNGEKEGEWMDDREYDSKRESVSEWYEEG